MKEREEQQNMRGRLLRHPEWWGAPRKGRSSASLRGGRIAAERERLCDCAMMTGLSPLCMSGDRTPDLPLFRKEGFCRQAREPNGR